MPSLVINHKYTIRQGFQFHSLPFLNTTIFHNCQITPQQNYSISLSSNFSITFKSPAKTQHHVVLKNVTQQMNLKSQIHAVG